MNTLIPESLNEIVLVGPVGPDIIHPFSLLPQIAVDGGETFAHAPFLWVGDGDSLEKKPQTEQTYTLNPQKEMSDLAYTFSLLKKHPLKKLHLWGFLGERRDHELFNFGESSLFLENREKTEIHYYNGDIHSPIQFFSQGSWIFEFKGAFSLASLAGAVLKMQGEITYPISHPKKLSPLSSFGLSNSAHGRFLIEADAPFFMIRDYK